MENRWLRRVAAMVTLLFCGLSIQATVVTGIITDPDGEPLMQASVKLLNPTDSAMVKGVVANLDGQFTIQNVREGNYILQASYVGFKNLNKGIHITGAKFDAGKLVMDESSTVLKEVSVTGIATPIKVMQDTVEYNADSYKTAPNAVVEDLLKRLPGVEVDAQGKITANGKEVTKILVDGKEFFADDPKVASKNLPVNMVQKLQVVDRKSDVARITGVDDGEDETVINLTVKKGMNNGWFGTIQGGPGTDSRYTGSFNINRFWNGNQVTFLGSINNINEPGFTDSNGGRFRRFGGDNGITLSRSIGLNFNIGRQDEKLRVGGDIMFSNTSSHTTMRQERTYLFPDSASYASTWKNSRDKGNNFRGDFRLMWKPDTMNTLEFRPNFSLNINKSWSVDSTRLRDGNMNPVNSSLNDQYSHGHSFEFGGRLIYTHLFNSKPGRSFSLTARYQLSNVREKEDEYSLNRFFLFGDSADVYDQFYNNHTWSNSVMGQVSWTEPLGNPDNGNFLIFSYRMNYKWNNADRMVYDIQPDGYQLFNDTLSNSFRNHFFNQDIRLSYKKVMQGLNIEAGLSLVPAMQSSKDLLNSLRNIDTRWVWNVAPFLRMQRKFSKTRSLHINYRGRSSQASISQLQPVPDTSDPMNVTIGNPDLKPTFSHNLMARFQDFDQQSQRAIMAMGFFTLTQNSIISRTDFNSLTGARTTTYENVNGVWSGRVGNMLSFPFRNKTWQFASHMFLMGDRAVGYNNSARNASTSFRINVSPGIRFTPDNLYLDLRPIYSLQTTHNSLQSLETKNVQMFGGRFDGTYNLPFGLTLQSDLSFSKTTGYAAGYNSSQWLWNASVSYEFLRNRSATISIKAYDLLQSKKNISRNVTANYIDDTDYNSLTRYFMVTFAFRFNTFGAGNQPADAGYNNHRGPGGPPPGGRPGPRR